MGEESDIVAFVATWWPFGAFLLGIIGAYWSGKARQEFNVESLTRQHAELLRRVENLEREQVDNGRSLVALQTTTNHIETLVAEIRAAQRRSAE